MKVAITTPYVNVYIVSHQKYTFLFSIGEFHHLFVNKSPYIVRRVTHTHCIGDDVRVEVDSSDVCVLT
jgi:hypothetical protein